MQGAEGNSRHSDRLACFLPGQAKDLSAPLFLSNMTGRRAISTTSRRELSSSFFPARQGTEGNSRHSDRLACFLPARAKDLSAPLLLSSYVGGTEW